MQKRKLILTLSSTLIMIGLYAKPVNANININKEVKILQPQLPNLSPKVLRLALDAYQHTDAKGLVRKPVLTVIDFTKSSAQKRMWIIDLKNNTVPFHTYTAHGRNSGMSYAKHFSNKVGSHESSIGTFLTANTYYGHDNYSLRLKGLEKGVNDHAFRRSIVIHGAWYANPDFIHRYKRMGRSFGCPSVPQKIVRPLINKIKNGSVVFAYYPNKQWLKHSTYL